MSQKFITPRAVLSIFSAHFHLPSLQLEHYHPREEALAKFNEEVARRFVALPLFQLGNRLYVAVTNPEDLSALDYLAQLTGLAIEPVLALRSAIEKGINRYFLSREQSEKTLKKIVQPKEKEEELSTDMRLEDKDAPVIKLVNHIFSQAIRLGASDVHLAPFRDRVWLRYRVDGILHEFPAPPVDLYRPLVSRIKILSNLDIAERRMPQDGRARIQIDERDYDLRISIVPNLHGEGVVIRVLDTGGVSKNLTDLGFDPALIAQYKKLIQKPYGIFLVTGPTGSGKTTTLYATLKETYSPKRHMLTLEDPVEYQLDGITQIQINSEIGYTFAHGLRSVLRHDPDTIMLGEIRDLESAEIAIRSSLTGHFVFSTLHTNDAPSAVSRLVDMGVPSYLIFASLVGVMAQRLVRRLCEDCKKKIDPAGSDLAALGLKRIPEGGKLYGPVGCAGCSNLGYKGRLAIGELLEVSSAMRRLSPEQVTPGTLRDLAGKNGFTTLRESALKLLHRGITSIEEVMSITEE